MPSIAPFDAPFAHGIYKDKYANGNEEWHETAFRATHYPLAAIGMEHSPEAGLIEHLIRERMFLPGGGDAPGDGLRPVDAPEPCR